MSHRFRVGASTFVLAVVSPFLVAWGGDDSSSDGGKDDLTFVIASAVVGPKEEVAVVAVAQELGYFEEEGISVKTVNSDGSVAAAQAVGTGKGDVTAADAGSVLAAVEKNVDVVAVGGLVQNWPWQFATMPGSDITKPEDLKGKKVGVISLASGSAPYARAFIRSGGLDPEKDVELLPVGVGAQAMGALEGGDVDAIALYGQAYAVIENEGNELAYLENPDIFQGIRSITFTVAKDATEDDPEMVEGFLRAAYKAMLFSAQNPEAAMRIGYKVFPSILGGDSVDERLAGDVVSLEAWLASATPLEGEPADWTDWGAISEEDWSKTQAYTLEAAQITGEIPLDDVWNDSFLDGANDFDVAEVVEQADTWSE
ncbi:PhnD/SsuA/transferrin family substrate-binding protein [Nocardioides sp. zg-579]|uniref:Thiamine pyrimidine synthase n=1 Tax=Nocardioides marmotae TaxID=2663857 RepID=A0A6I3JAE4_9ACTN|nr:ABC transporter substrate-binding protein [Nocardioides marmotae]MCR6030499.1 PhnD/SsuA/transferrin family substrate-binding protein [Gordonia jinghuaiqii]MTB94135.1 PhnD/SsuA/transferrin family substrate-binding protein [Nocardioides marmotae]QKE00431.1 ABC transporter substrate-binding protein [Nocardioides marmotae]